MKTTISWYHFGLRGLLSTAFGVVAALTVLASSSAIISYDSLGRSLGAIAERSLPEITRASVVVRAAGEVAAAARDALIATARKSHQQLAEKLAPLADDAGFTLTIGLQTAADKKNLEDVQKMLGALVDDELGALQA